MGRYVLHEIIGKGGMGSVYRATDRLTGDIVALKQVTLHTNPSTPALPTSPNTSNDIRLALASEFQTLASLRHPHIINVIDYGFDDQHPFFTMRYLPHSQTIVDAGKSQPIKTRIRYLQQLLSALAYLHQRGILHRDLKPENVLIIDGQIQVLDFGLAVAKEEAILPTGTLAYIAPEVLDEKAATEVSDLYGVGVMAYELFAGKHPFDTSRRARLIKEVLNKEPDLTALEGNESIAHVIGKLLEKDPQQRYHTAYDAIVALSEALHEPPPPESRAIRDSFIQAAKFVGRHEELHALKNALDKTKEGQGSSWLVGGESGVGKSRLLNEIRIRALVSGALVLQGQGVAGSGGLPFQLWRTSLRRLVLSVDVDDLTAGVLQALIPDISTLLERAIIPAPPLDEKATQMRLYTTIVRLFALTERPIVLILEDLQWTRESLEPLEMLNRVVTDLPLLIIGSYRSDERPDLPTVLPTMNHLMLNRFTLPEMTNLSVAILGNVGAQSAVLNLLQQETEGNAFFVVEVVRALAENAGRLQAIGTMPLPTQIFPQGIQSIVQRRLASVPATARDLLTAAAIAGRQLDEVLLTQLTIQQDISSSIDIWLMDCANASVIEIFEEEWRFTHEKLREGILATLRPDQKRDWHKSVAQAIETAYPQDDTQAANLMYHWGEAEHPEKERYYAQVAGNYAAQQFLNDEALRFFNHALALTTSDNYEEQYQLLLDCLRVYDLQGNRDSQSTTLEKLTDIAPLLELHAQANIELESATYETEIGEYEKAIALIQQAIETMSVLNETANLAKANVKLATVFFEQGNYANAQTQYQQAHDLAKKVQDKPILALSLRGLGRSTQWLGDYQQAKIYYEQSLSTYQDIQDVLGESNALGNLGTIAYYQGRMPEAQTYYEQCLIADRKSGYRFGEGQILNNLGNITCNLGYFSKATNYYEQGLTILKEIGSRWGERVMFYNLGRMALLRGDYDTCHPYLQESLELSRELGDQRGEAWTLYSMGCLYETLKQYEQATTYTQQGLKISQDIGDKQGEGSSLYTLGSIAYANKNYPDAQNYYQQALNIQQAMNQPHYIVESWARLAQLAVTQNQVKTAQAYINDVVTYLNTHKMISGMSQPSFVYWVAYEVLQALGDTENAGMILHKGYQLLQEQADRMPAEQQKLFRNISFHQSIQQAWNNNQSR